MLKSTKLTRNLAKLMLVAVFFSLTSCVDNTDKKEATTKETQLLFYGQNVEVTIIDSCEYVYFPNGNASWGTHKGNCKFCLARSTK